MIGSRKNGTFVALLVLLLTAGSLCAQTGNSKGGGGSGTGAPPAQPATTNSDAGTNGILDKRAAPWIVLDNDEAGWVDAAIGDLVVSLDLTDEILGASLQPVSDALRAQLAIPKGQGLLVASLHKDSPSAQAGLRQNDVLLTLADKPLASAEDLTKHLRAAGEAPVSLKVLRNGKRMSLQVRPIYKVTLGPVEVRNIEYFIGVSLESLDDALRTHLGLSEGKGVLLSDIVKDSPAEKAGLLKHDIVLEMSGKPIDKVETLVALVQANKEKNTNVIVLREGKPLNLAIAGKARKVEETANAAKYLLYNRRVRAADSLGSTLNYTNSTGTTLGTPEPTFGTPGWKSATSMGNMVANPKRIAPPQDAIDLRAKIDQIDKSLKALNRIENLENEIKSLHEALEKINETLKKR